MGILGLRDVRTDTDGKAFRCFNVFGNTVNVRHTAGIVRHTLFQINYIRRKVSLFSDSRLASEIR